MKVILIAAISADGFIAQSSDQLSLDWTSKEDTQFFVSKTKEVGHVIMGRKTFDTIGKPLSGRVLYVHTSSLEGKKEMDGVVYTKTDPGSLLTKLESDGIESVVVAGGGGVYSQYLASGLVTDMYLTVEPVVFGEGIPFVKDIERIDMQVEDVIRLGDQSVLIHYRLDS